MSNQAAEVAGDMLMYLFFAGFMQAVLTAALAILGLSLWFLRGWRAYRSFILDRDPIGDFVPWLPSTGYMVDTACGGHPIHGATWNTLRLAWFAVAVPVWLAAIWSYKSLLDLRQSKNRYIT